MPKNILRDVVPRGDRRSIREIPLSHQHKNHLSDDDSDANDIPVQEIEYTHREEDIVKWRDDSPRNNSSRWTLWLIGAISSLILIVVVGNFFTGATVSIIPKAQIINVNQDFTAKPNAPKGELSYTPFSLVKEKEISVPADGEIAVETRASGKIIIYNNYSTSAQRLVKNTRFETPDGLIYKIADSVTIPGKHTVTGKSVPGSIEVTVFAESTGSDYNIGLTDFTIPGFKSNATRYANFYARSKTVMAGGKIGMEKNVSEAKMQQARITLDTGLRDELLKEANAKLPADSILYNGAYRISFEKVVVASPAGQNTVLVKERASFSAYFLKRSDLAREISAKMVDSYDGSPVLIEGDKNLVFRLHTNQQDKVSGVGPITFTLKGPATVVWDIDKTKISTSLIGKKKSELSEVISTFPAVASASVVIRPFWKSNFPKSAKDIKVSVETSD